MTYMNLFYINFSLQIYTYIKTNWLLSQAIDEKLTPFISKLDKSQRFCEKLQTSLERKIHELQTLKKEHKLNSIRKTQMEKKMSDVEQMTCEMNKQKTEFLQYKENTERKTTETLLILNKESESVRCIVWSAVRDEITVTIYNKR